MKYHKMKKKMMPYMMSPLFDNNKGSCVGRLFALLQAAFNVNKSSKPS